MPPLRHWRLVLLLLLIGGLFLTYRYLPVQDLLSRFLAWADGLGVWGPVLFAAAYVVATIILFPGSILTLGGGFMFGLLWGTVAVSAGSTLGAALAFLAGRTFARAFVERRIAASPRFQALDRAVAGRGFQIVLLTRLSPVFPFSLQNYAYGLTRVRFRDYLLASWVGMLPGTVMYVYLGSTLGDLSQFGRRDRTPVEWTLYAVGLLATVAVTVYVTWMARQALTKAAPSVVEGPPGDTPDPA